MNLKQLAASRAMELVHSGMRLGLGTGSTTAYFIDLLGEALQTGKLTDIAAVPTSEDTARRATGWGIPLTTLAKDPLLDLAVDGADEVDPDLNMIKGLGKAALREKIVEMHAQKLVIIVDESKLVPRLGLRGPLPVEIIQFEWKTHLDWLTGLCTRAERWCDEAGRPYVTDNGNFLVRCYFETGIANPYQLARRLADQPGIVEHGLFLDMADLVIVAGQDGIRSLERAK